jgi:hypothetical protein
MIYLSGRQAYLLSNIEARKPMNISLNSSKLSSYMKSILYSPSSITTSYPYNTDFMMPYRTYGRDSTLFHKEEMDLFSSK